MGKGTKTKTENLVFAGGGVKGVAYAGVINALDNAGILSGVKRVAGASAGSIAATLIALNYDSAEIKEILLDLDLKSFEDGWDPFAVITKYGLYEGKTSLEWVKSVIEKKGLAKDATFKDLHENGGRELHIIVTDLVTGTYKDLNYLDTPGTLIAEAIRASISIPFFFCAWKFSNREPDEHIYVDGGFVLNYPLTIFDKGGIANPHTIGFCFGGLQKDEALGYKEPLRYAKSLFNAIINAQTLNMERDEFQKTRSVIIDPHGIPSTEFDITEDQKRTLVKSGKKATEDFLSLRK